MSQQTEKFSFFMGDDQFEHFMKAIEKANKEKRMIKVEVVPRLKNVGYISFIEVNSKPKEVKKHD